jgi:hypothetical protein
MSSSTAVGACHDATFVISLPSRHSLFASRQSLPFRLGRSLALPFFSSPSLVPRPVLSRCLPKRSLLKQAEKLEGASPDAPKIFGSAGALPSRKPLAIRYSLPFWLGRSLALPICPLSDFLSTLGTT